MPPRNTPRPSAEPPHEGGPQSPREGLCAPAASPALPARGLQGGPHWETLPPVSPRTAQGTAHGSLLRADGLHSARKQTTRQEAPEPAEARAQHCPAACPGTFQKVLPPKGPGAGGRSHRVSLKSRAPWVQTRSGETGGHDRRTQASGAPGSVGEEAGAATVLRWEATPGLPGTAGKQPHVH